MRKWLTVMVLLSFALMTFGAQQSLTVDGLGNTLFPTNLNATGRLSARASFWLWFANSETNYFQSTNFPGTVGYVLTLGPNGIYAAPGGSGSGSVTSVGLGVPSIFGTNAGNVTSTGLIGFSNVFQSANQVLAGPTSGSKAEPAFRALVNADIPSALSIASENIAGAENVDNITVTNAATLKGAVQVQSTVNVTGAETVGGTLTVTNGIIGQSTENLTGAFFLGGILTATNTIVGQVGENLTGALNVGGVTTHTNTIVGQAGENLTGALTVGGATTLSNSLAVQSTAQFQSTVNVTGAENVNSLNATGAVIGATASFSGRITNANLTASRAVVSDSAGVLISATGTPDGTKFLRDDNTYATPAGAGTVTSVGLAVPSNFGTNGGNISGSGLLSFSNVFQSANQILAGPTSGGKAEPAFRSLVNGDLPTALSLASANFSGALAANSIISTGSVTAAVIAHTPILMRGGIFTGTNDWQYTNLTANTSVSLDQLTAGVTYRLSISNGADYTVTWETGLYWANHPGVAGVAATNGISDFFIWRDPGVAGKTNISDSVKDTTFLGSLNITLSTNDDHTVTIVIPSGALTTNLTSRGMTEILGHTNQGTENITGTLSVGGNTVMTNALQVQGSANITGASAHGATATFTNGTVNQGSAKITGEADVGGTLIVTNVVQANNIVITNNGSLAFGTNLTAPDTFLVRDNAPNVLGMRNGAVNQAFRVYNSFTDSANNEYLELKGGGGSVQITAGKNGSGTLKQLYMSGASSSAAITLGGTSGALNIDTSGNWLAGIDNTYNIGASGASRPKSVYLGTSIVAPTVTAGTLLTASNQAVFLGAIQKKPLLITSTATTNQIDFTLQNSYRWTNMATNIVLQLTNIIEGAEIDYYFTGATNAGPDYTVFLTIPNPGGVNVRWGINSPTNGPTSFTVTNNARASLFTKVWLDTTSTNIEAFWQPLR